MAPEKTRYDAVAMSLHWLTALCIFLLIPLGFFMEDFPIAVKFAAYAFHKSLGITVLALSVFRVVWRLMNPPPPLPATIKPVERLLAHGAHALLYFLIIAMPLTGWIFVSATPKYPIIFFWLGQVPFLPMPEGIDAKATADQFKELHETFAYGAIGLISIHVLAALKHHFILRDGVLARMMPHGRNHA